MMIRREKSDLPPRKQRCVLQPMSPDSVPSATSAHDTSHQPVDGFNFFVDNNNMLLDAIEDLILGPNDESSVREGSDSLASSSSRRSNTSDFCERIATVRERRTGSRTPSPTKLPPRPLRKATMFGVMQDKTQRVNNAKLENKSSSSDLDDMLEGLAIPLEHMSPPKGQWKMLPNTTKKQNSPAAILKSTSSESEVLEFDSAFDFDGQQFPDQVISDDTTRPFEDENREQRFSDDHLETIETPALHTSSTEEFEIVFQDDTDEPDFPDIKGSLWGNQALWEWGSQNENAPCVIEPKSDKWAHVSPISEDTQSQVHSVPLSPFDTPRPSQARREASKPFRATTKLAASQSVEKRAKESESMPSHAEAGVRAQLDPQAHIEDSVEVPFIISPSNFDSRDTPHPLEEAPTELGDGFASPIYTVSSTRLRRRPAELHEQHVKVVPTVEGVELERSRTFMTTQLPSIDENQLLRRIQKTAAETPQIDTGVSQVSVDQENPKTGDVSMKLKFSSSSQSKTSGFSSRNGSNRSFGLKRPPVFFRLEQYARMKSEEEKKAPNSAALSLLSPSLKWAQRQSNTARNLTSKWKSPHFHSGKPKALSTGGTLREEKKHLKLQKSKAPASPKDQRSQDQPVKINSPEKKNRDLTFSLKQATQVRIQSTLEPETIAGAVEEYHRNQSVSKSQVSVSSVEVETVLTPIPEQSACRDLAERGDGNVSPVKSGVRKSPENDKPVVFVSGDDHTPEGSERSEIKKASSPEMPKTLLKEDGKVLFSANDSPPKVPIESKPRRGFNSSIFNSPALKKVLDLEACPNNLRRLHRRSQQFEARKVTKETGERATGVSTDEQRRTKTPPTTPPQSVHQSNAKPSTNSSQQRNLGFGKIERSHTLPMKSTQESTTSGEKEHGRESVSQVVDAFEVQLPRTKIPPVSKRRMGRSSSSPATVREMMKVVASTRLANRKPKTATEQISLQSGYSSLSKTSKSEHAAGESSIRHRKQSEKQVIGPSSNVQSLKSEPQDGLHKSPDMSSEDNEKRQSVDSPDTNGLKEKAHTSSTKILRQKNSPNSKLTETLIPKMSDISRCDKPKIGRSPKASPGADSQTQSAGKQTCLTPPVNLMKRRQGKQQAVACPDAGDKSIQDEPCLAVSDEAKRIVLMNSTISSMDDTFVAEPGKRTDPTSSLLKLQEIRSALVQGKDKTPSNRQVRKIRQAYNQARRAKGNWAQKSLEEDSPALSLISLVSSASTLSAAERKITERLAADVQLLTEIKKRKKELSSIVVETKRRPETSKTPHSKESLPTRPTSARVLHALSNPKPEPAPASVKSANFSVYKMAKWMSPSARRRRSSVYP